MYVDMGYTHAMHRVYHISLGQALVAYMIRAIVT